MSLRYLLATPLLVIAQISLAQDSSKIDKIISFPDGIFAILDKKTGFVEQKLDRQTNKYINRLQNQEHTLRKKLWKKDSVLAKQLFDGADEKYNQLRNNTGSISKYSSVYSGHLDSLTTALHFVEANDLNDPALQNTLEQHRQLQLKFDASEQIRQYLSQRQQLLKNHFEKLGMLKDLKKFRQDVYYYQQQVREYKQLFEDPSRIEAKLMEIVLGLPQFKDFFAKNSMLGSLFALPSSSSTNGTASLAGLQTRAMVSQSLVSRFGSSSAITQMMRQNVQTAQSQMNQLKNMVNSFSTGSCSNAGCEDIPGFKPNTQKTKSFLKRLEYGANVQSQKARYFFPVTSDIGLSLGYKINDKSSIGIGASYKIGWGNNWNRIKLSHQGIGLRTYLDWKIKGAFYFSGGYEQNYRNMINSVEQLRYYSAWQTSGLIGLSKKYTVSKKMKGEMKLMWDFMSYSQVPNAQPVLFRVGYSFK